MRRTDLASCASGATRLEGDLMKAIWLASLLLAIPAEAQQLSGDRVKVGVLTDLNGVYSANAGPGSVRAAEMAAAAFMKRHPE
jgi:hypothetical protein